MASTMGYEEKELIAWELQQAADWIGRAINLVDRMARRDPETVRSEGEAADKVAIEGPELMRAITQLRRRYNRES